jgi:hypothetical protein
MNIGRHPAPGLGELQPGWFVVPQNPVDGPISYIRGIGDILATGGFAVPQNPVTGYSGGSVLPIGVQPGTPGTLNNKPISSGLHGCGCGGGCGSCGSGMGDISAEFTQLTSDLSNGNYTQALTSDTLFSIPVWAYGLILAAMVFSGGKESHYSRARRAVRAY